MVFKVCNFSIWCISCGIGCIRIDSGCCHNAQIPSSRRGQRWQEVFPAGVQVIKSLYVWINPNFVTWGETLLCLLCLGNHLSKENVEVIRSSSLPTEWSDTIMNLSVALGELKIQFPHEEIRQNCHRQLGIERRHFGTEVFMFTVYKPKTKSDAYFGTCMLIEQLG